MPVTMCVCVGGRGGYLRVDVHVLLQADGVAEGLPADAAAEGPRSAVGAPDVDLQPVGGGKHLKQDSNDGIVTSI